MHIHYFAYGSNMDERAMSALCVTSRPLGAARLDGYSLGFNRRSLRTASGVADVVPEPGCAVWGVLYEIDELDMGPLDAKEGLGKAYRRELARVELAIALTLHEAVIYTVINKEPSEVPPSQAYHGRMLSAARRHAFPGEYIERLERTPVERPERELDPSRG